MNLNFYFAFQKGLLQHRYIPTVSANTIARERIRILHGDGANHRQKEKMIRLFIFDREHHFRSRRNIL